MKIRVSPSLKPAPERESVDSTPRGTKPYWLKQLEWSEQLPIGCSGGPNATSGGGEGGGGRGGGRGGAGGEGGGGEGGGGEGRGGGGDGGEGEGLHLLALYE